MIRIEIELLSLSVFNSSLNCQKLVQILTRLKNRDKNVQKYLNLSKNYYFTDISNIWIFYKLNCLNELPYLCKK